ncbi:protein TonB [Paucibacter oligotrophus]|uniref:Protein TonB n=1 Tax=Roseateles oligotrophus TaxID=1769250 RepID=A0A840L6I4_9BURK|nr:energy transducer TonB [Roseateles oligotrophus]MBB4844184.1 protein TonB [Roseateles oligotrophus]
MKRQHSAALFGSALLHLAALGMLLNWTGSPHTPSALAKGRLISLSILPAPPAAVAPKHAKALPLQAPPLQAAARPTAPPQPPGLPSEQARAQAKEAARPAEPLEAEASAQASRPAPPAASQGREPAPPRASAAPSPSSTLIQASLPPEHQPCLAQITERFYPSLLRERGLQALVTLLVQVDEQGRAAEIKLKQGSGLRLFDEAAHKVARACRFTPARLGEQAVSSWVEYPVRFALQASPP